VIDELEDQEGSLDEKLSDPLDIASRAEMAENFNALAQVRRNLKRDQEPNANGVYPDTDCSECGSEIGYGRLQAAIQNSLCIHCASARELLRKTHA
jgi:RNA polymerase-binding transcription factor DksA